MRRLTVPLVAVLVAALAGCSASRGGGGPAPTPQPSVSTSTAPAGTPSPSPSSAPATAPPPTGRIASPRPEGPRPSGAQTPKTVNVTGTVTAGTEPGCLLLEGYLLVNAPTSLVYEGVRVKATLEVRGDLVSTCMQGTPAMITSAQRL
ncbi:hypothetical protein O7635_13515 [Asanoa sp. WMMD1127]|uniref:hypothetical protein n=1 Tax=Asanoa sp. WMMD1127 TaxID=3016107 RepID=UPI0024164970|nr:hypothetical protein [Asanoa sp. WMMD1127]MDG4822868.1 hypothetical protein [Asanoa sp. WMMD1127]